MTHGLHETIHNVYDAALHPEIWQDTIGDITELLHARTAELTLMDISKLEPAFSIRNHIPPESEQEYFPEIFLKDLRIPRLLALPDRGGILTEQLMSAEEWKNSPQLRDWLDKYKIGTLLACNATTKGLVTWLGVSRKGYDNPFADKEIALYNMLLLHVKRAISLQMTVHELKLLVDGLAGVLSLEDKAVIFLDHNDKVIFSNMQAQLLADKKTISLTDHKLSLTNNNANNRLAGSLHALANGDHSNGSFQDVMIFQNGKGCEYGLRLLPYPSDVLERPDHNPQQTMVIICNLDTMKNPSLSEINRFCDLFGLTPAETRVVANLAAMKELSDYARERGISIDTPRKQLKSAMEKIGVHSQKELLRRLERFCFIQMR